MQETAFAIIHTATLRLRCMEHADSAALAALLSPDIGRELASWPYPTTPAMMKARVESVLGPAYRGDSLPCVIERRSDAAIVGWMVLRRDRDDRRRGALGYWVGEAFQGKGIARAAAISLIEAGFSRLDLDVIEAGAQIGNAGSFAVMRACGMVEAGARSVYASARDRDEPCLFYELRRSGSSRSAT